jgi:FkbM family methyltransferase
LLSPEPVGAADGPKRGTTSAARKREQRMSSMGRLLDFLVRAATNLQQVGVQLSPVPPGAADSFLKFSAGVIHVGANTGQERDLYAQHGLRVVWIEPIPEIYNDLLANIRGFSDQIAINALITDLNDKEYDLHVASNDGASSSILELHHHYDIWPQIHYVRDVRLKSSTLPTALEAGGIDFQSYDSLVIDTQGSELQVLAGAADILPHFKWIKTEAADFEAYKRCTTVSELTEYLRRFDFRILQKERFATRAQGGAYYDILFGR